MNMTQEEVKVCARMCVGTIEAFVLQDDIVSMGADPACCDAITSVHVAETSPLSRDCLVKADRIASFFVNKL